MPQGETKTSGLSIFHKILLAMMLIAFAPIGGMWYMTQQVKEYLTQEISLNLTTVSQGLVTKAEGFWDMNVNALQQNAASPDMVSMDPARQNPVLKTFAGTYNWVFLAFTSRPDGLNVGRSDDKPPLSYADRAYFKQVMQGNPLAHELLIGRTSGKPTLVLAVPIMGPNKTVAGMLAFSAMLKNLTEAVASVSLGTTGTVLVLDSQGRLVASGRRGAVAESMLQDMSNHPALSVSQSDDRPIEYEQDHKRVVARTMRTKQGWSVIVQQDYDEAFAPLLSAQKDALVVVVASVVLILVLALSLSRRLSRPICELTKVAENISLGKLDAKVAETRRGDEIGALARAIERLGVSVQMAFERLRAKT
jgi:methyl-accepting chemotaxis protein